MPARNLSGSSLDRRPRTAARQRVVNAWVSEHSMLNEWLLSIDFNTSFQNDTFMISLVTGLRRFGTLTLRQTEAAQRIYDRTHRNIDGEMAQRDEAHPAPSGHDSATRVNRYEGRCQLCHTPVAAGAGELLRNQSGAWITRHREDECAAISFPDDTPAEATVAAAAPDDVTHIYNGTYTIDNGTEHLTYQIYTATRGQLQGKRIIKRMTTYGMFSGFAFVSNSGTVQLWRRFQAEADHRYVQWAHTLLAILNNRENDAPGVDSIQAVTEGGSWTVQRTRACRRCNRALTVPTSIESGIGPECQRRDAERTTAANHHAVGGVRQSHQALHDTGECFCSNPSGTVPAVLEGEVQGAAVARAFGEAAREAEALRVQNHNHRAQQRRVDNLRRYSEAPSSAGQVLSELGTGEVL